MIEAALIVLGWMGVGVALALHFLAEADGTSMARALRRARRRFRLDDWLTFLWMALFWPALFYVLYAEWRGR